ncbi:hypothetical protein [Leptospira noguchii]|uniref:FlaG protein n=1 Tax=Leptospira noguchii serovar Panama str. CZ214 TaxID=1001595 RepID=T0GQV7_9LEPT|nr:hypothetical protein [Leptospira noguchii]EQA69766.1 hypothetical protein LEP1GSC059_2317 [Leptospira noguchii serovar Panama str. CZ214]
MIEAQTVKVTREEGNDGVKYNIVIPNDEANIHLILEEDKFISLVKGIGALEKEMELKDV